MKNIDGNICPRYGHLVFYQGLKFFESYETSSALTRCAFSFRFVKKLKPVVWSLLLFDTQSFISFLVSNNHSQAYLTFGFHCCNKKLLMEVLYIY